MRYIIYIHKKLFDKATTEQKSYHPLNVDRQPLSRFARYIQDHLFKQSGIYLSDKEVARQEKYCLASKNNSFEYYYPSKQVIITPNQKMHPLANILHHIIHTRGICVTLSQEQNDDKKNEPLVLPALKHQADLLREKSKINLRFEKNNVTSIIRDNKLFFTRSMIAQQTDGTIMRHINDWANVVIVENKITKIKAAYVYDSSRGLNDAAFMYGLSDHTLVCSGVLKITTHRINDKITIPQLLFSPTACATSEKKDTFNSSFMLYMMSLHTPLNLGFVNNPNVSIPKTGYVYGGFSNENEREKANKTHEDVLKAIRQKQQSIVLEKEPLKVIAQTIVSI